MTSSELNFLIFHVYYSHAAKHVGVIDAHWHEHTCVQVPVHVEACLSFGA